jgi:hypothetical protein
MAREFPLARATESSSASIASIARAHANPAAPDSARHRQTHRAIARRKVWVESEFGCGAQFCFTLPV